MEASAADLETLDRLSSDVVSDAHRSLDLLRAIETTIQALCYERTRYEAVSKFVHVVAEAFRGGRRIKRDKPFDPEGKAEENLLRAQEAARKLYDRLVEKRDFARQDEQLADDDGVADEFARTIAVVADLHNGLNELRWAIGEYDADIAKGSGSAIGNARELEGFLKSL